MQDFNKVISLFVGLFVVIFVIAFLLGRFKIGGKTTTPKLGGALGRVFNIPQPSDTPIPTPKVVTIKKTADSGSVAGSTTSTQPSAKTTTVERTTSTYNSQTPLRSIPQTGPELFVPLVGSMIAAGMYLRKRS